MEKCGKCNTNTKLAWNIGNTLYCKRCHPTTIKLINIIDKKAINRSRLPKDLGEYFTGDYVNPAMFVLDGPVCKHCKERMPYYTWYDNNYPSKMYRYCTKCNRISHKLD